jgi:hypothetical protein
VSRAVTSLWNDPEWVPLDCMLASGGARVADEVRMMRGIVAVFRLLIAYGSVGREGSIDADSAIPEVKLSP